MLVSVNLELLRKFCKKKRYFLENLHSWHKFYTTAGRDGRDKSQLWPDLGHSWLIDVLMSASSEHSRANVVTCDLSDKEKDKNIAGSYLVN